MKLYITIKNEQTNILLPIGVKALIKKCCLGVLKAEKFKHNAELSVSLVNDHEIQKLNKQFRSINKPTDVLSFPLGVNGKYNKNADNNADVLGDIVISIQTALRQSKEYDHAFKREIGFLTVHSMFHLLGYDHENGKDEEKMRKKEEYVLNKLGLSKNDKKI